jgi:hypothetical protein
MSDTASEDPLLPLTRMDITALFTRADGQFLFARWGRPIAPVVFGVFGGGCHRPILKGAIEAVVALAGHAMAETDPELGANLMVFFIRDWSELSDTPGLDRLLPDLPDLVARLEEATPTSTAPSASTPTARSRRPSSSCGWTRICPRIPAETIALSQVVQTILLWSDTAFLGTSPLAVVRGWPRAPETGDRRPDPRRL